MAGATESSSRRLGGWLLLALVVVGLTGCSDAARSLLTGAGTDEVGDLDCSIDENQVLPGGVGRDGIPALTDPLMVPPDAGGAEYLADDARVIGFGVNGQWYAVPLNIMWWHEVVNLNLGMLQLAVTHCPLTGSSLAFDRRPADGAEFGVSGLLYLNNLIMYDRNDRESLWPQMLRGARCGPKDGTALPMIGVIEMRWDRWRALHPNTVVVAEGTGYPRDYNSYPYGSYDDIDSPITLFPMPDGIDERRPPKERILGVPDGSGGVAYPFGLLDEQGAVAVVQDQTVGDESFVVIWSRAGRSAMAFQPAAGGQPLTLEVVNDTIRDQETGSVWTEDGRAVSGPLVGEHLPMVDSAFVAFWFAWAGFYPETEIWDGGA